MILLNINPEILGLIMGREIHKSNVHDIIIDHILENDTMNFRLRLYEIYRNGNWELFCILKDFTENAETWEDWELEYELTPEEIVILGLYDYTIQVLDNRRIEVESVWSEISKDHNLDMDNYDFFPTVKKYQNTYWRYIYDSLPDWVFSDLEHGIDDLSDHIAKNQGKMLLKMPVVCPDGCPLGEIKYEDIMRLSDQKTAEDLWAHNCDPITQSKCKLKRGKYCSSEQNFMRRRMAEMHWSNTFMK
jgi:hypothetical protein